MLQRVPYNQLLGEFHRVLLNAGVATDRAAFCAEIFADNTRDGIYSHGLHRFAGFVGHVKEGRFDKDATPECVATHGLVEQWEGHRGIGLINAWTCMARAIELAGEHALGCVALRHTNHWMRAGTYALQAADAGCIGICWTNTNPMMPAWGTTQRKLGNNPIAYGIPKDDGGTGGHVLLDMAMTQYAMGHIDTYKRCGEALAVPGGYDEDGNLTTDAAAIRASGRALPFGYWKGSGMAMVLDLIATLLSGGMASFEIGKEPDYNGASQVFIAFDVQRIAGADRAAAMVDAILADFADVDDDVTYPGQRMLAYRRDALESGVPVETADWEQLLAM